MPRCDARELGLDREPIGGVVREDDLQLTRIIDSQEGLDGAHDRRCLVRQVRRDDRSRRRIGFAWLGRWLWPPHRDDPLAPDEGGGQHERDYDHEVDGLGDVVAEPIELHVQQEREHEADQEGQCDLRGDGARTEAFDPPAQEAEWCSRRLAQVPAADLIAPAHRKQILLRCRVPTRGSCSAEDGFHVVPVAKVRDADDRRQTQLVILGVQRLDDDL